jgi:hypothetical protein
MLGSLKYRIERFCLTSSTILRNVSPIASRRRAQVLAGTYCGFDTSAGMGKVAEDVVWAKLTALSEGAKLASDRLFS